MFTERSYNSAQPSSRQYNNKISYLQVKSAKKPAFRQNVGSHLVLSSNLDTGLVATIATSTLSLANFTYAFDKVGNLTKRKDLNAALGSRAENFCYDVLNRLINYRLTTESDNLCTGPTIKISPTTRPETSNPRPGSATTLTRGRHRAAACRFLYWNSPQRHVHVRPLRQLAERRRPDRDLDVV
jgi:hypothetical protein